MKDHKIVNMNQPIGSTINFEIKNQNLPKIMTKNGSDDFQTPPEALKPLLPYLKKEWIIWECAAGKRYLVKSLVENDFNVIDTDITDSFSIDFLDPRLGVVACNWDCIITNPPFSKKNEFIEKCYELDKPFALLLPLAALETQRRQKQWKEGLQLIVLDKRLHFETPNNAKSHCWFASAWFTYKLNLPKDIIFGEI